jgi:hypothetical protein
MPLRKTSKLRKPSDWDEFENICTDLVEREWEAGDAQRYGRQGQTQNGVDILCTPYWMEKQDCAIQVKNTDDLSWDDIEDEISSAENSDLEISEFYVFTTMDSDVNLQKKVKKENSKRKKNGKFEIEIWMWDKITRKMAEYEDMLKSYYPESELDFSENVEENISLADWRDEKIEELKDKDEIEKIEAMEGSSPYANGYYVIS